MTLRFGPFQVDPDRRELSRNGERVAITPKVFDTLVLLIENRHRVVDKAELFHHIWPDCTVEEATLTQTVSMLRKGIGCSRGDGPRYIATIPGRGYQFVGDIIPEAPLSAPPPSKTTRTSRWPIALILAAAIALPAWLLLPKRNTPAFLRPEPFTSLPGRELFPEFSPEGDRIAFIWEGEKRDNWDVYVKMIGQDAVQRLTDDPGADWSPAWSPDGKQIAFVRHHAQSATADLMVMPAIGGPARTILQGRGGIAIGPWNYVARMVAWHPDSEHLITSYSNEPSEPYALYAISVKTGEKRKLTHPGPRLNGDLDPAVSPDGRRLAFRRKIEGWNSDVYVTPLSPSLETSGEPALIGHGKFLPAWSRDGREILMVDTPARPILWSVSPGGGPPRQVREPVEAAFPAVARSGNRSAFSVVQVNTDVWQANLQGPPNPARLVASTYIDMVPDVSPDNRRIAFASNRSGHLEIWVCDRDGSDALQLTRHAPASADCPAWSPDGTQIAYHANQDNFRDLFVISASGGTPRRLTHREGMDIAPAWSRDGKWIYFTGDRQGKRGIWKIPAQGGEAVWVTEGIYSLESHDGKALYYDDLKGLWTMPIDGGPKTRLLPRTWANANYEVTPQGVYFLDRKALNFYSFQTKSTAKLFDTPQLTSWGLAISPDARTALFSQMAPLEADIMLIPEFR